MESSPDTERISLALRKLLKEKRSKDESGDELMEGDDEQLLLSRLLSQLESLKEDGAKRQVPKGSTKVEEVTSLAFGEAEAKSVNAGQLDGGQGEIGSEEIVKELKAVKRQNTITHWLLSVMIVLTLTWQLSEVSLILKVKDGLSHPFRSFGGMLSGMLWGPGINAHDAEKQSSSAKEHQNETPSLPSLKLPDFPHLEMPDVGGLNGEKQ